VTCATWPSQIYQNRGGLIRHTLDLSKAREFSILVEVYWPEVNEICRCPDPGKVSASIIVKVAISQIKSNMD